MKSPSAILATVCLLLAATAAAFDHARPGYQYEFPRDHFSHSTFKTEWWYYTGNLQTAEGRRFGFELTFFRYAINEQGGDSAWDIRDIYPAHLTLSDIDGGKFFKTDRLNRQGPGLAGADTEQARIWNGNWEVQWLDPASDKSPQRLKAYADDFSLEFTLTPAKPPVIHGLNGVSQKAAGEGQASHYISFTRLEVTGSIALNNQNFPVTGQAWMDHEFSTDSLGPNQTGWDWMSIQLDDQSELMLYRMRRSDGSTDPYSSGTYIDPKGRAQHLDWAQIRMTPIEGSHWKSPATGGLYPLKWQVEIPDLEIRLDCATDLEDQEVVSRKQLGPSYWEGAMNFKGHREGRPISATGYLEMTGYDKPLTIGPSK
ncbi:MAG: carotenoid 1,2-hydratase [Acidobacteria bacterium]|nr:carotenoid 1,2-hydratase [Acidobacteriota bacterium]